VSPEHAAEYVDLAEVLVSPRHDGTSIPLKIYTYLHAGKPIVATRLFAHTQILSEEVARLVEPNEKAMAEGIIACLTDPEYGTWLGTNARNLAQQKYNHSNYISKVAQIYHALGQRMHPLERAKAPKVLEN
jgi:glycosyltransferase involved in cell wall biosynthesis